MLREYLSSSLWTETTGNGTWDGSNLDITDTASLAAKFISGTPAIVRGIYSESLTVTYTLVNCATGDTLEAGIFDYSDWEGKTHASEHGAITEADIGQSFSLTFDITALGLERRIDTVAFILGSAFDVKITSIESEYTSITENEYALYNLMDPHYAVVDGAPDDGWNGDGWDGDSLINCNYSWDCYMSDPLGLQGGTLVIELTMPAASVGEYLSMSVTGSDGSIAHDGFVPDAEFDPAGADDVEVLLQFEVDISEIGYLEYINFYPFYADIDISALYIARVLPFWLNFQGQSETTV